MPLLQEYPQGYWEGNQFILPTLPPPPQQEVFQAPVAATPVSPLLRARPLLVQSYDGGGYMDPTDPMDPMDPGPADPSAPDSFPISVSGSPMAFGYSKARNLGLLGSFLPWPGLGLLGRGIGAAIDISEAEAELSSRYKGLNPDLSWWDAFLPWGKSAVEQQMDEMNALQDYYSEPDPTPISDIEAMISQAEAEEAWAGFEGSFDPFSPGGWSTPGEDPGGPGDDAGDDKIACTMMNHLYGFGSFRNAIWMRYARDHMPEPEWELGYHKVYGPLVKMMPTHPWVRKFMRWFARTRTATLRRELRGKRPTFMQAVRRGVSRPIVYAVGWLVKRGFIEPADKESIKREIENANICL